MASSDEDLLPPPLLPIKPSLQTGHGKESRCEKEREPSVEFIGNILRREHANVAATASISEMICDGNRSVDLPPAYLQALLAKVRALGLISSCGANAETPKRSPPLTTTKTEEPRLARVGTEASAIQRAQGASEGPFPVVTPTLLFNAPTAFDIFALHHNPIVLAIRAYQFDLLQKQVVIEQPAFKAPISL